MTAATPPEPKPAATVVLIRDGAVGVEAFLMRRDNAMAFAGGMTVFPGGGVDSRDMHADVPWLGPDVDWWAHQFGVTPELASALVCAAARETFEECGVLFAGTSENSIVEDAAVYHQARKDLSDKTLSFAEFLQREGLQLRADLLRPWANWITPEAEPRRYDTFFFVAALPAGQDADGNNTEAVASGWQTPRPRSRPSPSGAASCFRPPGRSWTPSPRRARRLPRCWGWHAASRRSCRSSPSRTAGGSSNSTTSIDTKRPGRVRSKSPR